MTPDGRALRMVPGVKTICKAYPDESTRREEPPPYYGATMYEGIMWEAMLWEAT